MCLNLFSIFPIDLIEALICPFLKSKGNSIECTKIIRLLRVVGKLYNIIIVGKVH